MPETITIGEIKNLIKEEGLKPSDLFGREPLVDDPVVKGYVAEERKTASGGEYAHRKRTDEAFDKAREDWEKEKGDLEGQVKTMKVEGAKIKSAELFGTKIKERKLDDKQSKFLKSKQDQFTPEDLDSLDKEVDKFMDSTLEEFKATAKIFGHEGTPDPPKEGDREGTPPEDTGAAEAMPPLYPIKRTN